MQTFFRLIKSPPPPRSPPRPQGTCRVSPKILKTIIFGDHVTCYVPDFSRRHFQER